MTLTVQSLCKEIRKCSAKITQSTVDVLLHSPPTEQCVVISRFSPSSLDDNNSYITSRFISRLQLLTGMHYCRNRWDQLEDYVFYSPYTNWVL